MLSFQLSVAVSNLGALNLYGPGQPDEQLQSCATSPRSLRRPAVPVQPATADKANICSDTIHQLHVVHPVLGRVSRCSIAAVLRTDRREAPDR